MSFGYSGKRITSSPCSRDRNGLNDIVIVKDDHSPRNASKTEIVEKTYPDKDGLVRKVRLRIADDTLDKNGRATAPASFLDRPVQQLVLLLKNEEYEDRGIPT